MDHIGHKFHKFATGALVFSLFLYGLLFSHAATATEYNQLVKTQHFKIPGAVHDILPLTASRSLIAAYGEGVILADLNPSGQIRMLHTAKYSRQAEALALSSNRRQVFVANGSAGLDILALNNNNTMQLVGRFNTPSYAFDIALAPNNRIAYIADNHHGVIVLDVSQVQKPRQVAHIPTRASSAGVTLSRNGQRLYIADQTNGIHVVDVRNPRQPKTLSRISPSGQVQSIALSTNGRHLFSANNNGGMQIFSLNSQPPQRLSRIPGKNAFAVSLSASGRTAFVADLFQGIQVIDVSNPARPGLLHTLKTAGQPEKVSLPPDKNTLWVANGRAGITVFKFK